MRYLVGKPAAHVDHGQVNSPLATITEHRRRHRQRAIPSLHLALLRTDMERNAHGVQAQTLGEVEHLDRHLRIAAEFARQRPLGARAVIEDAAEHLRAGSGAGDLLDLGGAVDSEQANAERVGARDIALLLDGVAEGDAVRRRAGGQRHLDLGDGCSVEARAERSQQVQHLGRRVGLHRVEHARVRQRLREDLEVVAHDFEVDHEAGLGVVAFAAAVAQEFLDTVGHSTLPNGPATGSVQKIVLGRECSGVAARWRRDKASNSVPNCAAVDWLGNFPPAHLAMKDKPFQ